MLELPNFLLRRESLVLVVGPQEIKMIINFYLKYLAYWDIMIVLFETINELLKRISVVKLFPELFWRVNQFSQRAQT